MNVKSRAQLIVWCLPHLGFVESEARQNEQPINAGQAQAQAQTIPAGSTTVAGPTIIPGRGNSDIGMGM